jgi:hypothetical protein
MKTFTVDELKEILRKHKMWLLDADGGEQADLTSADLKSVDLRSADLTSANLTSADLRSADLTSANLTSADLTSANLTSADLDKKYIQISCIGSRKGITTYCIDDDEILCGCWKSSLDDFEKRVHEIYPEGQFRKEYDLAINFFKAMKTK